MRRSNRWKIGPRHRKIAMERVVLNELEVSTEDELPREDESQGEVCTGCPSGQRFSTTVGSGWNVTIRYDTGNRANSLRRAKWKEEQISVSVGPPTQNASKEKVPGKRDQTPTEKKNESPAKGKRNQQQE